MTGSAVRSVCVFPLPLDSSSDTMRDQFDFVKASFDDAQIFLHDPFAFAAEFFLQLIFDGVRSICSSVSPCCLHHRRGGEECSLKRDALHSQLQIRIARFFAGNFECVQIKQLDLFVDDDPAVGLRECWPRPLRSEASSL